MKTPTFGGSGLPDERETKSARESSQSATSRLLKTFARTQESELSFVATYRRIVPLHSYNSVNFTPAMPPARATRRCLFSVFFIPPNVVRLLHAYIVSLSDSRSDFISRGCRMQCAIFPRLRAPS